MLAVVRLSSVRSGRTSLIAPTSVVFPDPNPPAIRILCAVRDCGLASERGGVMPERGGVASERTKPIQYLLKHFAVCSLAGRTFPDRRDSTQRDQVGKQHTDHAHGQRGVRGDVGDGDLLSA